MSTVELEQVTKTFADGITVVGPVDVTIRDSELFVIVGPSGCGKTTLLRIVAGLEQPTTGDVRIDGVRVNEVPPRRRDVAMTFQHHALYPHLTVAENLGFPLRVGGRHARVVAARVRQIAELLDIADVLDRRPRQLSGGQQQRVALGRSMVRDPRVFLMDEPMSNLDTRLRVESRARILELQRRSGTTTLFVTHDQVEAMALADRLAVMRSGRIVQSGPPDQVYRRPVDVFVAQFMSSPPMALVGGTVVRSGDEVAVRVGSDTLALGAASSARGTALRAMGGRPVVLGIRPEALRRDAAGTLVASVEFTESLGPDQLVHASIEAPGVRLTDAGMCACGDRHATIAAYVDARDDVNRWEPFRLSVDPDRIHLFDPTTGAAIGLNPSRTTARSRRTSSTRTGRRNDTPGIRTTVPASGREGSAR